MESSFQKVLSNRVILLSLLILLLVLSALFTSSLLKAGGIGSSLYRVDVTVLNSSGVDIIDGVEHFILSTQSLIDGGFISSDTLNATVHEGSTDVAFMPGTTKIDILAAFNNGGTDETTAALNTTTNDITLPTTGNSVYEIALHNPAKIIHFNTGTVTDAIWATTWEYYNGTDWTGFSNIVDGTNAFTVVGNRKISWDLPNLTLWPQTTLHSVTGFWLRVRVFSFTSLVTAPLGTQIGYETGIWWAFTGDLAEGVQATYGVYLGGTAIDTFRHYFPGVRGVTVPDDSSIEPESSYFMGVMGKFSIGVSGSTVENQCFICKSGAARIHRDTTNNITYSVTGGGVNTTVTVTGTAVSSTLQTIIVADNGTNVVLFFTGLGLVEGISRSTNSNTSDWTLMDQGTTYYMRRLGLSSSIPSHFTLVTSNSDFNTGTFSNTKAVTGTLVLSFP